MILRPHAFPRPPRAPLAGVLGLLLALVLGACSQHREVYPRIEPLMAQGDYVAAMAEVEKAKEEYGERNSVLYNMDRGVLFHYAGEYEKSNVAFEAAERRIDELFTESITGNILAFGTNDNTLPYKGEDFESVVINIYRALNYYKLGNVEAALVEARKVDNKLKFINDQYREEFGDDKLNEYTEDAFARMLMGIFYEAGGTRDDLNDAFISNRLAADIYQREFLPNYATPAPDPLKVNLVSSATFMGAEELADAEKRYPAVTPIPWRDKRELAQVYVVHFAGRSPVKVENSVNIFIAGQLYRMAFPVYRSRSYVIGGSRLVVDGRVQSTLQVGQPTGAIAVRNLKNRQDRVVAKAALRGGLKVVAAKAIQDRARQESEVAGLIAWAATTAFTAVSEQADLRAWQTLPDRILIGQALLTPGRHSLEIEFTSRGGGVISRKPIGTWELKPGEIEVLILHSSS